jgi:hypothetical protein
MTQEKKINYQILIRGDTRAYTKEQVTDKFIERLYDVMKYGFELDGHHDGKIIVEDGSTNDLCIGYYDKEQYRRVRERIAWKLTEIHMRNQFVELNERIKVYECAIQSLGLAKLGVFGDHNQVDLTLKSLKIQMAALNDILVGAKNTFEYCNVCVFEESKFDRLPDEIKEEGLDQADLVIKMFSGVFVLDAQGDTK